MKKFLTLGALALTLAVLSTQQASAWTNFKFGAGINLGYQAGGNNFGWGLFRNGNPPCAGDCGGGVPTPAPHAYLQPGSLDQGMTPPAASMPAQPQSYSRPNYTVNYQYQYPYSPNYGYNYRYNYRYATNSGYNR